MQVDILAIGVHPDDIELSCAGTILAAVAEGKKVAIVDLTQGELGTRGTAAIRKIEAANAALVLGVVARENLQMADGFFENNQAHQIKVIEQIRKYKPSIILCNANSDRHPDHGRAAKLVADAAFLSGLVKIETFDENGNKQDKHRPAYVFNYIQDRYLKPDFLMDISHFIEKKIESIKCYTTQFFNENSEEPATYISSPNFLETVKARDMILGKRIGVAFAEGFTTEKMIGLKSFDSLITNET
jgi:N-acetylglucosamine malate deacetylase 1